MVGSAKSKLSNANLQTTKLLTVSSNLRYPDRLVRLSLDSLVVRRLRHGLILTYKIIFGLTDMNPGDFFTFANSNHNIRGPAYKLLPSHCRVDVRKSFYTRDVLHSAVFAVVRRLSVCLSVGHTLVLCLNG